MFIYKAILCFTENEKETLIKINKINIIEIERTWLNVTLETNKTENQLLDSQSHSLN